MKKSTLLIIGGIVSALAVLACAVCFIIGAIALPGEEDTTVSEVTAVVRPEYPTFTPTTVIAQPPAETPEAEAVVPTESEPQGRTMYVCGYDRCRDSGEYGNLIFEAGINVWNNPDPDRGGAHHQVAHQDEVTVVGEKRVNDGPGGLWYELEGGGWIDDLWLTDAPCNPDNLSEYTFASCWGGEAVAPADTPTPSIPELEILSHQSYEDSGWFHIVGEVRNNSDRPMEFIEVVATLYDDTNNVTGTDFTYTYLNVIPPGGKSPFETGTDEYAGTTQYKLQVQGSPGDLPRQDLVINSHNHYEDNGWLHVRGEVQNTGDSPAEFVQIVITLYDAAGNVVGTDFTYVDIDPLPPGGTSPFETGTDHYPGFDHYEIYVQGD